MSVSPQFFRRDVNQLVMEKGPNAVVHVRMDDGKEFYVRRVRQTHEESVLLDIYTPPAAKPFIESTSAMHVMAEDFPCTTTPIEISLLTMTSAQVLPGNRTTKHIRFER